MRERPRVVAIDDEPEQLVIIEAILSDDYDVTTFTSGPQALRDLHQWPDAVVLCDQRMPTLTGDEVMTRIRIMYPDTVRVMVTGYVDTPAIVRALNEGNLFGYLKKPYEPQELRGIVERAVRSQETRRENRRLQDELLSLRAQVDALVEQRTSALADENRVLRDQAQNDALTGLFNARSLQMRLRDEEERLAHYGQPVALVLADIDDFKKVNDTHGHLAGDEVLRAVADALRQTARQGDFVARYGGEEFVVIATGTGEAGALLLAERLRQAVQARRIEAAPGTVLSVTVSLGVSASTRDAGPGLKEALRRADEAMYRAKRQGKNATVTWSRLCELLATKPQSVFVARNAPAGEPPGA